MNEKGSEISERKTRQFSLGVHGENCAGIIAGERYWVNTGCARRNEFCYAPDKLLVHQENCGRIAGIITGLAALTCGARIQY